MALQSVFQSDTFIFEIGPEKQRFHIHKKVIEEHSPVLASMMNNGVMDESINGVAHLEDVRPRTFHLFAEYIYNGIYRVESPDKVVPAPVECLRRFEVSCLSCGTEIVERNENDKPSKCMNCDIGIHVLDLGEVPTDNHSEGPRSWPNNLKSAKKNKQNYNNDSTDFQSLRYSALGLSHPKLQSYLLTLRPSDNATKLVSNHAMLFVFSQMYMVDGLADLCLHKLHRDLLVFTVNKSSVKEIVDLLKYTYINTSSMSQSKSEVSSTDGQSSHSSLRRLVMSYAIENAKSLVKMRRFQAMLQEGGEVVSDFAKGMAERISK